MKPQIKFSYAQYILKETETELITLEVSKVNSSSIEGTVYYYNSGRFVKAIDKMIKIEIDTNHDQYYSEQYFTFSEKTIYARDSYNPESKVAFYL